jgi:CheY-like chemotaxis protein
MPVMDGREATRRIRAEEAGERADALSVAQPDGGPGTGRDVNPGAAATERAVILALTASSYEEQREEVLALGCDDFLRKPFREEELLWLLSVHLGVRYEQEDEAHAPVPTIDGARIAALPAPVRAAMKQALDALDVVAVEQALEALRRQDETLAAELALMLQRFQYAQAASLFEAANAEAD